jgi:hypothetical protein
MRNLTPSELFSKGIDAMNNNEFLMAEKYFLASLFELSKKPEDYVSLLGSLDQLSLYLYPKGNFESKDRALEFYKLFSRVDVNVSEGFAYALINGTLGDPDYTEAIKQISKAWYDRKLFIIASLLNEGKGFEKDSAKAAIILKSKSLKISHRSKQAKELYDSIGIEIKLNEDQVEKEIGEILSDIFKNSTLKLDKYPVDTESMLIKFFENIKNIPDIDIKTLEELKSEKKESDFEYQKRNLEAIYSAASLAPVFKENTKFCINQFAGLMPYIAYGDVMANKYVIRAGSDYNDKSETNSVIVEYDSIDELVNDGWRL